MSKEVIAIDIDDVLAANAKAFVAFSNQMYATNLGIEDYHEHWSELWQVDHDETHRRAVQYHSSGAISSYEHDPDATDVLKILSSRFNLVIITSRRQMMRAATLEWIDKHYKGIFTDIHFSGFWDVITDASKHQTKAEWCTKIGASYLIDDQLKHCVAAADLGIRSLLFGDYGWNQAKTLPNNVIRVKNWLEVGEYFGEHKSKQLF